MSTLVKVQPNAVEKNSGAIARLVAAVAMSLALLAAAPGTLSEKAHHLLHGLCAQRPSHSFTLGGETLPMDARMTGIYFGAAITLVWLVTSGRLYASGRLPTSVIVTLATFVTVMGVDGVNALLVDLEISPWYVPSNAGRFFTGLLAGTALGVALTWLAATSLWKRSSRTNAVVRSPRELVVPLACALPIGALAASQLGIFFAPLAIGLIISALVVLATLCVVLITLLMGRGFGSGSLADLADTATVAWIAAMVIMSGLAVFRFALEQAVGLPQLT